MLLLILATVERLKVIHAANDAPLDDNNLEVAQFCRSLEAILRFNQKGA